MHTARSHIYTWYGIYIQMVDSMDWEPHLPVSSFPSGSHNQDLLPGLLRSTPVYTDASEMNTTLHCLPAPRRIKIHNSDTVGNVFHHGQVMGNKQIRQIFLLLHIVLLASFSAPLQPCHSVFSASALFVFVLPVLFPSEYHAKLPTL